MAEIGVHDAKTHFSKLLRRVQAGESITVTSSGRPVAKLVPAEPQRRELGMDAGRVWIADDFDAPDPELERLFEDGK